MGTTGGSTSAPQPLHSPHVRTEQLMSGNSAPNSPMAMLNINSSHEKEVCVWLLSTDISQQIQTKLHFKVTKFTNYLQKVDLVTFL